MGSDDVEHVRLREEIEDLRAQLAMARSANNRMWDNYKRMQSALHGAMLWIDSNLDGDMLTAIIAVEDSWWNKAAHELGWDVDWEALANSRLPWDDLNKEL